jgi:hypothetical protein
MNSESNNYGGNKLLYGQNVSTEFTQNGADIHKNKVKLEIFGEEMIAKIVVMSGNSGRAYLPPGWFGHKVKIVRID